jgi:hypothetical protein
MSRYGRPRSEGAKQPDAPNSTITTEEADRLHEAAEWNRRNEGPI